MPATLVFDFDGTLHATLPLYAAAFRRVQGELAEEGWPSRPYTDEEISRYLGMTTAEMWADFYPTLPEALRRRCAGEIGTLMCSGMLSGRGELFAGTEETLDILREQGHAMALLSNCGRDYLAAARAAFGLDRWFGLYCCSGDYPGKSKAEIFPVIAAALPGPWAVVGDRDSDFAVARAHALPFFGCAYGYGGPGELDGCTALLTHITQLPQAVSRLQG